MENLKENRWRNNKRFSRDNTQPNKDDPNTAKFVQLNQKSEVYRKFRRKNNGTNGNGREYQSEVKYPEVDNNIQDNNSEYKINDDFLTDDEPDDINAGQLEEDNLSGYRDNDKFYERGYGLEGSQVYNVYEIEFRNNRARAKRARHRYDD